MAVTAPPYPVNLLLQGRKVLVVGGGPVAMSKVVGLLDAEAVVHVVAPEVAAEIKAAPVTWEERPYVPGEVADYHYVVSCTDDPAVSERVFLDAEAARVFVNAADVPAHCSATLPAKHQRGPLLVTVSTSGHSPALAGWLRDQLAGTLGPEHDQLLELLSAARVRLAESGRAVSPADWRTALDSGMLDLLRSGRPNEAERLLASVLGIGSDPGIRHQA
jgi:siroheme synthase-like protein